MAKTKIPFFSLGSHGTVANAITTQKRASATLVRTKPTPTDRYSLPQAYQRWLYQDYIAYWQEQTAVTKQLWETNARPYRMTGFAYWMKYHLLNLPDIVGMWRLDERAGNTAIDFSNHKNNGVVYGASLANGVINHSLLFDGIDDYVSIPHINAYNMTDQMTIDCFLKPTSKSQFRYFFRKTPTDPDLDTPFFLRINKNTGVLAAYLSNGASKNYIKGATDIYNAWHHIAFKFDSTHLYLFVDGEQDATPLARTVTPLTNTSPIYLSYYPTLFTPTYIDHIIIYNRPLTPQDIKRHAERSYPP